MTTRGDAPHTAHPGQSAGCRIRKGAAATAALAGVLIAGGAATMVTGFANTGSVTASEDCTNWAASVTLDNNVTIDKTIVVTTSIPGTVGIGSLGPPLAGNHYDTHLGAQKIWSASGPTPAGGIAGVVKLYIYSSSGSLDIGPPTAGYTATLTPATNCTAAPTISTKQSADGPVGTVLSDTASVTGGQSLNTGTGTVTFKLFGTTDPTCAAAPVFTSPNIHATSSTGTTANFVSGTFSGALTPGKYSWIAVYSGDANNKPASSLCTAEVTTVSKAGPAIKTTPSAGGVTGTPISDSATLTGGVSPTGTVVFKLYGPTDLTCSAAAVFTSTVTLPAALTSAAFSGTSTAGTYSWTAVYSGDANNAAASSLCTVETVVITSITSSGGGQGVQGLTTAVTTPGTGGDAAVGKLTVGGFLLLGGLGVALFGYMIPRRRRINS